MHNLIGIDLGRDSLMIAFPPADSRTHPREWRSTVEITYADPRWWRRLLDLIDEEAVIAAEPTGAHTLAPIARLIHTYRPGAQVWQIDHRTTGLVRETRISRAKNDRLDAITLCLIAADIASGSPPIGAQPFRPENADLLTALRLLVNQQGQLVKETTRHTNRLRALAFQIFPPFATSDTYLRALNSGLVSIADLRAAVQGRAGDYADGRRRAPLEKLLIDVPDLEAPPLIHDIIRGIVAARRFYDQELARVETDITALVDQPPLKTVTDRWRSMPGFSPLYAAALHIASGGHVLTMSRDDFVAALGANPRTSKSGQDDFTALSKRGYRPARAAMHTWTMTLLRDNMPSNPVREKFHAVKARGGKGMGAAKTKLARVLWGIARNAQLDLPPQ